MLYHIINKQGKVAEVCFTYEEARIKANEIGGTVKEWFE